MSPLPEETTTSTTLKTSAGNVTATVTTPHSAGLASILRQGLVLGSGFAGGGGIAYGLFELLRDEPARSFDLLRSWGSQFIIAIFAMWTAKVIFEKLTDRIGGAMDSIALEQRRQADAQELKGAKDDREAERMATLVEYSAAQSRQALEIVSSLATVVNKISAQMDRIEKTVPKPGE